MGSLAPPSFAWGGGEGALANLFLGGSPEGATLLLRGATCDWGVEEIRGANSFLHLGVVEE